MMNPKHCIAAVVLCCFSALSLAGAWGAGPFDNDDALDWVWTLVESDDISAVSTALDAANSSSGYLEAPTGSVAVAAAEVVAAIRGKPGAQVPEDVRQWIEDTDVVVDESLVLSARTAVSQVQDVQTSELAQLWSDSDDANEQWRRALADLASRLK